MRHGRPIWGATATCVVAIAAAGCGSGTLSPKEIFKEKSPATVQIFAITETGGRTGTGDVIDKEQGLVLTNSHVVAGAGSLKVRREGIEPVPAKLVGANPCEDLALIKMNSVPDGLEEFELGDSDKIQEGDQVVKLGYPRSLQKAAEINEAKLTLTNGTVQAANVAVRQDYDPGAPALPEAIQHSATVNHGDSGGPLINDKGELIGVNSLTALVNVPGSTDQPVQGQFYAISSNHVNELLPALKRGDKSAYVGWSLAPFEAVDFGEIYQLADVGTYQQGTADQQYLREQGTSGLFVFGSDPGSPADKTRYVLGNVLTSINGAQVNTLEDVCDALASAPEGEPLHTEGVYTFEAPEFDQTYGDTWSVDVKLEK